MRKKIPTTYFLIIFSILTMMSLPKETTENLRGSTVAIMAPTWKQLLAITHFLSPANITEKKESVETAMQQVQRLNLENTLLRTEIARLKEILHYETQIVEQLKESHTEIHQENPITKRHQLELVKLLQLQLKALPARVIFRSPTSWNHTLWIDVGQVSNEGLDTPIVAKNSPVLIGNSVIGIIDYVGKKQARVRLITDSSLTPSVRALRDPLNAALLNEKIHTVTRLINNTPGILDTTQQEILIDNLQKASKQLVQKQSGSYLAKGEIHGASKPLWRSQRHLLKGLGFNYDYADGEGPARDLRNGKPIDLENHGPAIPILKAKDILVTTGMDGVFPPHLLVAEVTKVHMLKEGDYYYELDAIPTAGNFDDLKLVFVLPPIGYDANESPSPIGW